MNKDFAKIYPDLSPNSFYPIITHLDLSNSTGKPYQKPTICNPISYISYIQSCRVIPFVLVCSYVPLNVVNLVLYLYLIVL